MRTRPETSTLLCLVPALSAALLAACGPVPSTSDGGAGSDAAGDRAIVVGDGAPGTAPTWYQDVAPFVYSTCVDCHRTGGIAPFSLVTYEEASLRADGMAAAVSSHRMPPTLVDTSGSCGNYRSDVRRLTDAQSATLSAWAAAGAPAGDPSRGPMLPAPQQGLSNPDAVVDMGAEYLPTMAPDQYRCFVLDTGQSADRFVTAYEVVPGEPRVVHHVILYSLPTAAAEQQAQALDAMTPTEAGYPCFGGPGATGSAPLALWAPGAGVVQFPQGTGLRLAGGRRVVLQLHYNLLNGSFPDRTRVRLQLSSTATEGRLLGVRDATLDLPPHMSNVEQSATLTARSMGLAASASVQLWGVAPHMHTLGRSLDVQLLRGAGGSQCLVSVPRWDFHWQALNFYAQPLTVTGNDSVRITCRYDTSSRDLVTHWGEGTQDEMCLNYLYIVP